MKRRAFLLGLSAAALAPLGSGCKRGTARERALAATVLRVLPPDARAISEHSRALQGLLLQLKAADLPDALAAVRTAWRTAALAWQRAVAFPHGPFVETKALLHAAYWPVRQDAIATMLEKPEPIDARRVALLGVNTKGMFAIEHMLFDEESPGVTWLLGSKRDRALPLIRALAADVCAQAEKAVAALGDGEAFAREFARGEQLSLNRLVNELTRTVEHAVIRIDRVPRTEAWRALSSRGVQGSPSGISTDVLSAWLSVCERIYAADSPESVASLVQAVSPAIHARAAKAFPAAQGALARLGRPLERVDPAQLVAAKDTLRQLEVILRGELASALGVAISFGSGDGD